MRVINKVTQIVGEKFSLGNFADEAEPLQGKKVGGKQTKEFDYNPKADLPMAFRA